MLGDQVKLLRAPEDSFTLGESNFHFMKFYEIIKDKDKANIYTYIKGKTKQ